MKQYRALGDPLDGVDVVLVGLFSARDKQYEIRLDQLAASVEARGSRVVGRYVQRRGVSDRWKQRPGGLPGWPSRPRRDRVAAGLP